MFAELDLQADRPQKFMIDTNLHTDTHCLKNVFKIAQKA